MCIELCGIALTIYEDEDEHPAQELFQRERLEHESEYSPLYGQDAAAHNWAAG